MRGITVLLVLLSPFIQYKISAQDSTFLYTADVQAAGISGTNTPFWIRSNQYGSMPDNGSFLLGRVGLYQVYNVNNPRLFQWSAGVQLVASTGKATRTFLNDLYIAGKAGPFELVIGQRKEFTGLGDSLMSAGPIAVSQNFRPYPKVMFSTPHFTNIIPGSDLLAFKFSYSDGILGPAKVQYGAVNEVPETYLHQKTLYLRLGGAGQKLNLYAGFNHQAMWGSETKIWANGLKTGTAYKYVVFGKPWYNSRVGNHFGTIDLGATWKLKEWSIFAYRQNIYEDGSLGELSNIMDGLNGLRFKRIKTTPYPPSRFIVNMVLIEYLYTKSQGGSVFDYQAGIFGSDNYFNHYVYQQGWSYRGRSIGTPLIGPQELTRTDLPHESNSFTNNNRLIALHLGLNASWQLLTFTFKGTLSSNLGTYVSPFTSPVKQASLFIHIERPISVLSNSKVILTLASDLGRLYPNSTALMIGWKTSGFLK